MSSALFTVTRRRLVLWNIAVTGVIILAFGLVAYVVADRVLSGEMDNQLAARAEQAENSLSQGRTLDLDNDNDYNVDILLLLSPDGDVLQSSLHEPLTGLPDWEAAQTALANDWPDVRTVSVGASGTISVRLWTEEMKRDGALVGVLQLGIWTQPYEHELHRLLLVLALVSFGALALALLGGIFLASRALAPVRTAFQRQRDFVGDASHELRTPLMLIRADIEVLGRTLRASRARLPVATLAARRTGESLPLLALTAPDEQTEGVEGEYLEDQLELVGDALGEIDRMTRLLRELLTLARLDGGAVQATHQPVALSEQMAGLVARTRRRAEAHGLKMDAHLEPGIVVWGDADQLRQLWLILLENAIRYNRPAGRITVTGWTEEQQACVCVTDGGVGIAPTDLPRVFERFYRADKAHTRAPGPKAARDLEAEQAEASWQMGAGAGLGLAIAQEIVQAHAGQISVTSAPHEGTSFTVRLPLASPR
ncbi:MAG TPA: ATP-binding protein [Ktedonobacterales bacterium]|jgi:signal transduction histidine kinase